jgi:predicted dinucleotide-binding enzyme
MKIGIIGAGQIGGTLTRRLTALGHKVFVANSRGPETLSELAAETGATAVSVPAAVRGVGLIVVTIPQKNIPNLPAGLFADTSDRVVVVDTGNYYPRQRDGRIEAIEAGLPESRWVEQQLGRPVIKAFITFTPDTFSNWAGLQARPGASPCQLRAMTLQPRPSF